MARNSFTRWAAWLSDVARRSERVTPLGDRTAQRQVSSPIELFGVEDFADMQLIPSKKNPTQLFLHFNNIEDGLITRASNPLIDNLWSGTNSSKIGFWIYPKSRGSGTTSYIFNKTEWYIALTNETSTHTSLDFYTAHTSNDGHWRLSDALVLNKWNSIIFSFISSGSPPIWEINGRVFTGGTEISTPSGTPNNDGGDALIIGNQVSPSSSHFYGYLDHIWIFKDTSRVTSQLRQYLYRELPVGTTDLTLYYDLNEQSGTTVTDGSVNALNGTISGELEWKSKLTPRVGKTLVGEFII